jgi:hypothetical protein
MNLHFPLSVSDIGLWLAVTAIILLITSELLSSSTGRLGNVAIEKRRLRIAALALGIGFMVTVVMRVFQPT